MANQNFVSKLGIGKKGYSIIDTKSGHISCLISGYNSNHDIVFERLTRITNEDILHIQIGSERNNLSSIEKLFQIMLKKKIDRIFVVGGGSLIDYAKRLVLEFHKHQIFVNFIVIPSRIGSGAESSMSSIINTKTKKSIEVNEIMMPDSVLYDFDLFRSLTAKEIFEGSLDSITHLLESSFSFLSNTFVESLSYSSFHNFLNYAKDNNINFNDPSKGFLEQLALLSFYGGLAQNNAGAGLCHAISHASEILLRVNHAQAISEYLMPTISLTLLKNTSNKTKFSDDLIFKLQNYYSLYDEEYGIPNIRKIFDDNDKVLSDIIELAQQDPCWKLMKNRVEKEEIITSFKNFYGII